MGTHNIPFHDKIKQNPYVFVFLSYRKNFVETQTRFRINHGNEPSSYLGSTVVTELPVMVYSLGLEITFVLPFLFQTILMKKSQTYSGTRNFMENDTIIMFLRNTFAHSAVNDLSVEET